MVTEKSDSIVWSDKRQDQDLIIRFAVENDIDTIDKLRDNINKNLLSQGFNQWNNGYPNKDVFLEDIELGTQFVLEDKDNLLGIIAINKTKNPNFFKANFQDATDNHRVISRLGVDPRHQGKGFAKLLMDFAENRITKNDFSSIRLGALDSYEKVVKFYLNRNYKIVGQKHFPELGHTYNLMEKILRQDNGIN